MSPIVTWCSMVCASQCINFVHSMTWWQSYLRSLDFSKHPALNLSNVMLTFCTNITDMRQSVRAAQFTLAPRSKGTQHLKQQIAMQISSQYNWIVQPKSHSSRADNQSISTLTISCPACDATYLVHLCCEGHWRASINFCVPTFSPQKSKAKTVIWLLVTWPVEKETAPFFLTSRGM